MPTTTDRRERNRIAAGRKARDQPRAPQAGIRVGPPERFRLSRELDAICRELTEGMAARNMIRIYAASERLELVRASLGEAMP